MFKLYSKGCQYALRVLAFVLVEQDGNHISAHDLCERIDIPESYSRKVLQALVQGGLLEASRGPGGGYRLSRKPENISVLDVIHAVDGEGCFDLCILGLDSCRPESPCPLHGFWSDARRLLLAQLRACTLAEIGTMALERDVLPAPPGTPKPPRAKPKRADKPAV